MTEKAFNQIKEGLDEAADYARRDVANTSSRKTISPVEKQGEVSPMVERVARAICQADEQNCGPPWEYVQQLGKHAVADYYDRARAAIEAMREPTEGMLKAGLVALAAECMSGYPKVKRPDEAIAKLTDAEYEAISAYVAWMVAGMRSGNEFTHSYQSAIDKALEEVE